MSKNSEKNNNQPLDDMGIKNDQIINCAEKIVDEMWIRLNSRNSQEINANDLHAYSATLCNVWSLVRNMMEFLEDSYDEELNVMDEQSMKDFLEDDEEDDDEDDEEDDDEDDDDEDDEDDEDDDIQESDNGNFKK